MAECEKECVEVERDNPKYILMMDTMYWTKKGNLKDYYPIISNVIYNKDKGLERLKELAGWYCGDSSKILEFYENLEDTKNYRIIIDKKRKDYGKNAKTYTRALLDEDIDTRKLWSTHIFTLKEVKYEDS